jgi:pimeloyl-ACP methyl ester carboxylesterase
MPRATINGVSLNYEIIDAHGPSKGRGAMALVPGGRNPLGDIRPLAELMAAEGYCVLLHDRRNCGASDIAFDASAGESEVWADDLYALLGYTGMMPAVIGGSSSGARLALIFAAKYPQATRALLLVRVTGGAFAVERLVEKYYGNYIRAVDAGGMKAVAASEHFSTLIANWPANRELLLAVPSAKFKACMQAWRGAFQAGADHPLIGTRADDLRAIKAVTCVVPGNDLTHPSRLGPVVAGLIPDCELHRVSEIDNAMDVTPAEEWRPLVPAIAAIFADFLRRRLA